MSVTDVRSFSSYNAFATHLKGRFKSIICIKNIDMRFFLKAFKAHVNLDVIEWIAVLLLPVIILSCIRTLKLLTFLSALSNVLYVVGVACLVVYAGRTISDAQELPKFSGWKTLPLSFGVVMMTFEGIGVVSYYFTVCSSSRSVII